MSLLKLPTAVGVVLILSAAGTLSLRAQTPTVTDSSSTAGVITISTTEPKKVEAGNKSRLPTESVGSDESPETKRDAADANSVAGPSSSTDDVRAEPAGTAAAQGTPAASADDWQFQLTPYLWLPTISGRAGIGNLITDTSTSVTNSGVELNFGFMSTFEARRNKLIILTDLQYSDLSTEKGNPGPLFSSTRSSFKTFVLDPEVGYRVLDNDKGATVDVLGGIRYWHVTGDLAFRAGILPAVEVSRSRGWVDGVVGLRGKAALSERFFVTGKADLGGGGSNFTYQLFGGVGVNVGKRLALVGGYRDLNVNYNKDGFLFDMSLHGPVVGFGIKF